VIYFKILKHAIDARDGDASDAAMATPVLHTSGM
jgi:hypothetical protein